MRYSEAASCSQAVHAGHRRRRARAGGGALEERAGGALGKETGDGGATRWERTTGRDALEEEGWPRHAGGRAEVGTGGSGSGPGGTRRQEPEERIRVRGYNDHFTLLLFSSQP